MWAEASFGFNHYSTLIRLGLFPIHQLLYFHCLTWITLIFKAIFKLQIFDTFTVVVFKPNADIDCVSHWGVTGYPSAQKLSSTQAAAFLGKAPLDFSDWNQLCILTSQMLVPGNVCYVYRYLMELLLFSAVLLWFLLQITFLHFIFSPSCYLHTFSFFVKSNNKSHHLRFTQWQSCPIWC